MKVKHKGAASELIATAWLLSQGYEVFRNISQFGPIDIIAHDTENKQTIFFDVKTVTRYVLKDGTVKFMGGNLSEEQHAMGVKALFVNQPDNTCFINEGEGTTVAEDLSRIQGSLN